MIDLTNQVVMVSGASGLLGRALVTTLLKSNARVVLAEIDTQKASDIVASFSVELQSRSYVIEMDIRSPESIENAIRYTHDNFGKITALVNGAYPRNSNWGKHVLDVSFEDFSQHLSWHLGGYFSCCQKMTQYFLENGGGNVINIASIYGVVAPDFSIYEDTNMTTPVEYAAIKSGVIQLTRYFASYFKGKNIRFNCVSPGGIQDGQSESFLARYKSRCINKGMLEVDDLMGTILFLLSSHSTYINGQNLIVDDGFTL